MPGARGGVRWSKPKRAKFHEDRDPKVIENVKTAFFLKSVKSSQISNSVLTGLCALKKPHAVVMKDGGQKSSYLNPFEDPSTVERISLSKDASLFCVSCPKLKKRPHSLILGRLFDHRVMDMVELIVSSAPTVPPPPSSMLSPLVGTKPAMVFLGPEFSTEGGDSHAAKLKSLLMDFYTGDRSARTLDLGDDHGGVDHVVTLAAVPGGGGKSFRLSCYAVVKGGEGEGGEQEGTGETATTVVKTSEGEEMVIEGGNATERVPRVGLVEVGPRVEFEVGKSTYASESTRKEAMRSAQKKGGSRVKTVREDAVHGTTGLVFPKRQDFGKLDSSRRLPRALRPERKRPRKE